MKVIEGQDEKKPSVRDLAREELIAERTEGYVQKMKAKLKEIEGAKLVVSNIEREIAELELKIKQETDALNG